MYYSIKRFFDLFFSILGLLLIAPLFLVIMLILKFTGEREIFYLQERMGVNNNPFFIYKFATMLKNSPSIGDKTITVRNDFRITMAGKYLRFTKMNELPQILNVIKGDMSLVGPRPLLVSSFYKYSEDVQSIIYQNRPGITGLGSLVFRDEEKLVTAYKNLGKNPLEYYREYIYPYKGQLEQWYFINRSFKTDFIILFLTFWCLIDSKSEQVFKVLKNIPPKPFELTIDGALSLKYTNTPPNT